MSPHPVHDWPKKPPVLIGLSTPISMKKWRENANEWKGKEIHAWQFLGKNKLEKEDNREKVDDLWQEEDHQYRAFVKSDTDRNFESFYF